VALDATLDDDLRAEGMARELVNRIQRLRKDAGLRITDRIVLTVGGPESVQAAATAHERFIAGETLAISVAIGDADVCDGVGHVRDTDIDGLAARIALQVAPPGA
jgi:isoleucyl-tRNA synthetase